MSKREADVVVAGHICLDVIPKMGNTAESVEILLQLGKLIHVGQALMATGGAVSNTGLALHRLGFSTTLMGKIGDDIFGQAILNLIKEQDEELAKGMIVSSGEPSSYSIVINPPNSDRIFLHCLGTNDSFGADDLDLAQMEGAKLFHFGYPPLMHNMYQDEGQQLAHMFQKVKNKGLTTSLDMARPDPNSEAGQANWVKILRKVLPFVDIFLPSYEEILYMIDRPLYNQLAKEFGEQGMLNAVNESTLANLAEHLLDLGVAIVGIKLGEHGLYMRTTADKQRLEKVGVLPSEQLTAWRKRECLLPCFKVDVRGTTGAGDCTIAGFLGGLLQEQQPEQVMESAVAVGAFNVQVPDATSGIKDWQVVQTFIDSDPPTLPSGLGLSGLIKQHDDGRVFIGKNDIHFKS